MLSTPVLIVGGSLVGLSASLFLSAHNIRNIVIEKHEQSALHPRAMGFTERTMEYFRAVGLASAIPQVAPGTGLRRVKATSLFGEWLEESQWTPESTTPQRALSPCLPAAIPQDKLEPLLRDHARRLGSDIRTGVEFLRFEETPNAIIARIRYRDSGREAQIRVQYLIAADGAQSAIREHLGIPREGVGALETIHSVLFHCAGADEILRKGVHQFNIENAQVNGFLTTYQDGRWVLMCRDAFPRRKEDLRSVIQQALGKPLPVDIITTGCWELAGNIAQRYQQGRVFLAGDAAHQLPPTRGGYGANTGIDDAYNLAWKLALVLGGQSSTALLETYTQERQPIGKLRHDQTFARPDYARYVPDFPKTPIYSDSAMELGQVQRSDSILAEHFSDLPPALDPDAYPGHPGIRAPHVWVDVEGGRCSTLDLFTRQYVVMTESEAWYQAALSCQQQLSLPIRVLLAGKDVLFPADSPFAASFGTTNDGVILVRPDGVVAWRTQRVGVDALAELLEVISRSACLKHAIQEPR